MTVFDSRRAAHARQAQSTEARRPLTRKEQIAKSLELYRIQLFRFCKWQHGNHNTPENAAGRALLKALLRCRLSEDTAQKAAPWIETDELRALQRAPRRVRLHDIGKMIKLPEAVRLTLHLWLLRPYDRPWPEVQRDAKERRRQNNAKHSRNRRRKLHEKQQTMKTATDRLAVLENMVVLTGQHGTSVSKLMEQTTKCRAFQTARGWSPLRGSSLRTELHRLLDTLEKQGKVVTNTAHLGKRGPTRWVTLKQPTDAISLVSEHRESERSSVANNHATLTKRRNPRYFNGFERSKTRQQSTRKPRQQYYFPALLTPTVAPLFPSSVHEYVATDSCAPRSDTTRLAARKKPPRKTRKKGLPRLVWSQPSPSVVDAVVVSVSGAAVSVSFASNGGGHG